MEYKNYTLPEILFLERSEHEKTNLEGRTVIQHNPSHTILEVIDLDEIEVLSLNSDVKKYTFEYLNIYGEVENHMFAVHFSLLKDDEIMGVFSKCADWYREYLSWEDRNISEEI